MAKLVLSTIFILWTFVLIRKSSQSAPYPYVKDQGMDRIDQMIGDNELQNVLAATNKYPGRGLVIANDAKEIHPEDIALSELYRIRTILQDLAQQRKRAVNMVPRLGRELNCLR